MHTTIPKIFSAEIDGIDAERIEVEADLNVGLHSFNIVGLADKAVSEARDRVNSALKNSGIKPPSRENRKITINLAPADIKKVGSRFDLPIAIAYLLASGQIQKFKTENKIFAGELSLDGKLRPINGALNISILAEKEGFSELFLPLENAEEAAMIPSVSVYGIRSLIDIIAHLENRTVIQRTPYKKVLPTYPSSSVSFSDIHGQESAKRALMIAAAGNHNVLMSGPPGTGKTMLAQSISSILPLPSEKEILEMTRLHSIAGNTTNKNHCIRSRPFRDPHHSASTVSIIGGGANPRPGEISLAHRGVLFLDELPEFHKDVLESLRQPLESGVAHISRAKKISIFPARFMLVAAMNPCPCGYFEDKEKDCTCSAYEILKYQKKISGPLLDRIDIQIHVPRIPIHELRKGKRDLSALDSVRKNISNAQQIQKKRFEASSHRVHSNAEMSSRMVDSIVSIDTEGDTFLKTILEKSFISPRGYYRVLKVAQTIADLDASPLIKKSHLAEALHYRLKTEE